MSCSPHLRLSGLAFALALAACAGDAEHHAALGGDAATGPRSEKPALGAPVTPGKSSSRGRAKEAVLDISAGGGVQSYLGALHAVVEDGQGVVIAGGDQDTAVSPQLQELSLLLPAGTDYTLRLSATTFDAAPVACRASVGPLALEAGAVAKVQVLAWDCGARAGYVPSVLGSECFWLADWSFVGSSSAPVGGEIAVSAAGHDARGEPARFDWSTARPSFGSFAEPRAARTSFRCQSPGEELSLTVAISDGECEKRLHHRVSCL